MLALTFFLSLSQHYINWNLWNFRHVQRNVIVYNCIWLHLSLDSWVHLISQCQWFSTHFETCRLFNADVRTQIHINSKNIKINGSTQTVRLIRTQWKLWVCVSIKLAMLSWIKTVKANIFIKMKGKNVSVSGYKMFGFRYR